TVVGPSTYTLAVTPLANGPSTVSVAAGSALDLAGNGSAAASAAVTFAVPSVATATTLTASPNATTGGALVTFTATVAPSPGNLGTVTFKENGAPIAGGANVVLVGGVASFTTSALAAGTHSISADFSGALGFTASASNVLPFGVTSAATT